MKNKLSSLIATALVLSACQAKSPNLTSETPAAVPPEKREIIGDYGAAVTVKYDPRVDILFVIDDSQSMKTHQENLSRNIQKFVNEFAKIKTIDFHIGFTVAYDSTRYGSIVPQRCADGRINFEAPGTLQPLLGPADKLPKDGRRFVTRDDDFATILRDTLDPEKNKSLVKALINPTPENPSVCPSGPENEEIFTPLLAALEGGANKGFRRDGAFFVAILVSDAKSDDVNDPADPKTPEIVAERLKKLTNNRFRVFSVAMKPGDKIALPDNTKPAKQICKPDPVFASQRVEYGDGSSRPGFVDGEVIKDDESPLATLAALTEDSDALLGSQTLSICSKDYGAKLAEYGFKIQQDTLNDLHIDLKFIPQVDAPKDISVRLVRMSPECDRMAAGDLLNSGERCILKTLARSNSRYECSGTDASAEWCYDVQHQKVIVFSKNIDWDAYPESKIMVDYIPVDDPTRKTTKPL